MNSSTPTRRPCCTTEVWLWPTSASRTTSRHQPKKETTRIANPAARIHGGPPCMNQMPPTAMVSAAMVATIGHGLGSTIWNGWVFV